jgi:hypothetical protein
MNEVNTFLDSLQQGLNSVTIIWQKASDLFASIAGGNQTVGGVVLMVVLLGVIGVATYAATNLLGN